MNKYIIYFVLFISIYSVIINNNFSIDNTSDYHHFKFNYKNPSNYCNVNCLIIDFSFHFILFYTSFWLLKFLMMELIYI